MNEQSRTAIPAWNVETDPANPHPNIWPECPTCETAYVYQRAMSLTKGWVWTWMRGCKHKSQPVLMTENGLYDNGRGGA